MSEFAIRPTSIASSRSTAKSSCEAELSEYLLSDDSVAQETKSEGSGGRKKRAGNKTKKKESPNLKRGLSKRTIAITQTYFNHSPTSSSGTVSRRSSRSSVNSPEDSVSASSSPKLGGRMRSISLSSTNSTSNQSINFQDEMIQTPPSSSSRQSPSITPQQQGIITKIMNLEDADKLFKPPIEAYSQSAVPMALLLRKANQLNLNACDSRDSEEEARLIKQRKDRHKHAHNTNALLKRAVLMADNTLPQNQFNEKTALIVSHQKLDDFPAPAHNTSNLSITSTVDTSSSADVESVTYKIVLIGNQGVGKTSYLKRYFDNVFDSHCPESIGVDFRGHSISLGKLEHKFQLWDITGAERFQPITKTYYKGAHVFGILCTLANAESMTSIGKWIDAIHANIQEPVQILLIVNKIDLISSSSSSSARDELTKEVSKLLAQHSKICQAVMTSAASGENIQESMLLLCQLAAQAQQQRQILLHASIDEQHSSSGDSLAASSTSQLFPALSISSEMSTIYPVPSSSSTHMSVNISMDYYHPARAVMTVQQSLRTVSLRGISISPRKASTYPEEDSIGLSASLSPQRTHPEGGIGGGFMSASSDDQSVFTAIEEQHLQQQQQQGLLLRSQYVEGEGEGVESGEDSNGKKVLTTSFAINTYPTTTTTNSTANPASIANPVPSSPSMKPRADQILIADTNHHGSKISSPSSPSVSLAILSTPPSTTTTALPHSIYPSPTAHTPSSTSSSSSFPPSPARSTPSSSTHSSPRNAYTYHPSSSSPSYTPHTPHTPPNNVHSLKTLFESNIKHTLSSNHSLHSGNSASQKSSSHHSQHSNHSHKATTSTTTTTATTSGATSSTKAISSTTKSLTGGSSMSSMKPPPHPTHLLYQHALELSADQEENYDEQFTHTNTNSNSSPCSTPDSSTLLAFTNHTEVTRSPQVADEDAEDAHATPLESPMESPMEMSPSPMEMSASPTPPPRPVILAGGLTSSSASSKAAYITSHSEDSTSTSNPNSPLHHQEMLHKVFSDDRSSLLDGSEDELSTESRLIAHWMAGTGQCSDEHRYEYIEEGSGQRMLLSDDMLQDIATRQQRGGSNPLNHHSNHSSSGRGGEQEDGSTIPLIGGGATMQCYCTIC